MNCHRARMAIVERDLGELTLGHERALDSHLQGCGECRLRTERESLLVGELRELRQADLPRIDVGAQVMRRVSTLAPVETLSVPQRQLAWSALSAVAAAVVLVVGIRPHLAWLWEAAGKGVDGTRAILSASLSVVAAVKSLLLLPWRILAALEQTFAPLFDALGRLEPVAAIGVSLCLLSMMLTIAWVVANDLRRSLRRQE